MDKLARQLQEDASRIDATLSPQLEDRIRASLDGVTPEPPTRRSRPARPALFWWASSLTGVAAAMALILIVNVRTPDPAPQTAQHSPTPLVLPSIDWQTRTAVLTSPLEQEFEDLQADIKKAEEAVKQDIDRLF